MRYTIGIFDANLFDMGSIMHKILFCFILALLPPSVFAWSKDGHETVGRIADANLTAKARACVAVFQVGQNHDMVGIK